jgi:DNA-binding transcriptional ArsR family regulator
MSGNGDPREPPVGGDGSGQTLDRFFRALSDGRRRQVVREIDRRGGTVSLTALSGAVAEAETDDGAEASSRRAVYLDLYHTHLSVLSDADIVRYDSEKGTVEFGRRSDTARQVLREVEPEAESGTDDG